jgi:uncharacterized membrane protein
MNFSPKSNWLIPSGLIVLSIVPALAGTIRVIQLGGGAEITPDNARFFAAPLPVVLHIVSATIFSFVGAIQFNSNFRHNAPNWHRIAGKMLVICGLVSAFSGLWMTQFYPRGMTPPASYDGTALYFFRLLAGSAMVLALCFGFSAIRRSDILNHSAWMMRSYALGLGAGTQVFTHIPWFVFPSIQGELARTLCMGAGWAINIALAEWFIQRRS